MKIIIKKTFFYNFLPSFIFVSIHLSSLLKVYKHSLFDFIFLPFLIPLTIYFVKGKKSLFLLVIFYFYSAISIFLLNNNLSLLTYVGWILRLSLIPILLFLYANKNNKNIYETINKPIRILLVTYQSYFSVLGIITILHFSSIVPPQYYGMGFPFYSLGQDSHMFGPALAYVFLVSLFFICDKKLYSTLLFPNTFKIITIILFFESLITGSRGVIIIYSLFFLNVLINYIIKNFSNIKEKIIIPKTAFKNFSQLTFSSFLISLLSIFLFSSIFKIDAKVLYRITRTFQLSFDPSKEISRQPIINLIQELFLDIKSFIFPFNKFTTSIDSGGLLLIYAGGLVIFLLLLFVWIYIIFKFKTKYNKLSYFIISSSLIYFIFNAPHIMIPRYWLAIVVPIILSL